MAYIHASFSPTARSLAASRRVVLADWRTGTQRAVLNLPRPILSFSLGEDDRVAAGVEGGGIVEVRPGGQLRQVASHDYRPRIAGDRIVFLDDSENVRNPLQQLVVAEPDGRLRDVGVATTSFAEFEADAQRILWSANGCLLVTEVTARAARAPGDGEVHRGAARGLRGTLTLATVNDPKGASAPLRFRIAAGGSARLRPRLTRAAYVAIRKRQGNEGLLAQAHATDPARRRSSATAGLQFTFG